MKKILAGLAFFIIQSFNWQADPIHKTAAIKAYVDRVKNTDTAYTLYLTIDDGPLEGAPNLNSVFRKEQVPADLFLVGMHVYQNKIFTGYYRELKKNSWFEFCNHSYTHANEKYDYYYKHPKMVWHDMIRNNDSLHFINNIIRMPARNSWRIGGRSADDEFGGKRTANLLKRKGNVVIGWDMEWYADSLNKPVQLPDTLFQELKTAFEKGESFVPGHVVLLCHDWMFTNPAEKAELEKFIGLVKAAGNIRFRWLTQYPLYKQE